MVWKAYEDAWSKVTATRSFLLVRHTNLDKFALQTFNKLAYKQEISRHLLVLCLFSLSDYYSHDISLRRMNLNLLRCRFVNIIFYKSNIFQLLEDDAIFMGSVQPSACIFEHYRCRGTHLFEFCLYAYFATILVVKHKGSNGQVFKFKESYPHKLNFIQRHYTKPGFDFLVALIETFFQCQSEKNAVLSGHLNTISQ